MQLTINSSFVPFLLLSDLEHVIGDPDMLAQRISWLVAFLNNLSGIKVKNPHIFLLRHKNKVNIKAYLSGACLVYFNTLACLCWMEMDKVTCMHAHPHTIHSLALANASFSLFFSKVCHIIQTSHLISGSHKRKWQLETLVCHGFHLENIAYWAETTLWEHFLW